MGICKVKCRGRFYNQTGAAYEMTDRAKTLYVKTKTSWKQISVADSLHNIFWEIFGIFHTFEDMIFFQIEVL